MDKYAIMLPISGGIIGYCTNWLAIKMVFKPHNEKRILGIKIPFTPGLIARERKRLVNEISKTIEEEVVTKESIEEFVKKLQLENEIDKFLEKGKEELKNNKYLVKDIIIKYYDGDEVELIEVIKNISSDKIAKYVDSEKFNIVLDKISKYVVKLLQEEITEIYYDKGIKYLVNRMIEMDVDEEKKKDIIKKIVNEVYESIKNSENKVGDYLGGSEEHIENGIKENIKPILNYVNNYVKSENSEELHVELKRIIKKIIESNLGSLASAFINVETIYPTMVVKFTEYVENPSNEEEIIGYINKVVGKGLESKIKDVGRLVPKKVYENVINSGIDNMLVKLKKGNNNEEIEMILKEIINIENIINENEEIILKEIKNIIHVNTKGNSSKIIREVINKILKLECYDIVKYVPIKVSKIKNINNIICIAVNKMVNKLDIKKIVDTKLEKTSMIELESLIMRVVKKELKAITNLGAVLGFVLGIIMMFI